MDINVVTLIVIVCSLTSAAGKLYSMYFSDGDDWIPPAVRVTTDLSLFCVIFSALPVVVKSGFGTWANTMPWLRTIGLVVMLGTFVVLIGSNYKELWKRGIKPRYLLAWLIVSICAVDAACGIVLLFFGPEGVVVLKLSWQSYYNATIALVFAIICVQLILFLGRQTDQSTNRVTTKTVERDD